MSSAATITLIPPPAVVPFGTPTMARLVGASERTFRDAVPPTCAAASAALMVGAVGEISDWLLKSVALKVCVPASAAVKV